MRLINAVKSTALTECFTSLGENDVKNRIEVSSYSDRLEVISLGSLPNSMTVEKMKAGQRSPRNTIVMEVLRDYGYVDYRGMGVRTKIMPLTKALTGKDPEFDLAGDHLKTILFR
ncbi:hypothetical protein LG003_12505 [Photorhabdus kleinii]|uniref:ATP-binding protein n=1 Tax=Photorhabdus kleinii TaxID=768034 RepID=UPI0021D4A4CB|nr:ATP-binding protein [Photorhabdus kleinii]MCT8343640.1 hypothetical protein [Photorhabdus kleinii]